MICARMRGAGLQAGVATLIRLQAHCWWKSMATDMKEFEQECPYCVGPRTGEPDPRPYGETVLGLAPDVAHFDFPCVGDSCPVRSHGSPENSDFRYNFVMMGDLTNPAWSETRSSCTAKATVCCILLWCETLGVPWVWVCYGIPF